MLAGGTTDYELARMPLTSNSYPFISVEIMTKANILWAKVAIEKPTDAFS